MMFFVVFPDRIVSRIFLIYSKNNSISTGYVRYEILENRNNKIVKIESVASLWRHAPVILFTAKVIYLFDKSKFIIGKFL